MVAKIPNDFFKVWTPDMAYVLGYWWADGGMPNKSLTTNWPAPPPEFLRLFVRGFIDGDGSLYWLSTVITTIPRLEANGTLAFLTGMASAIEDATGIPVPKCNRYENIWKMVWTGMYAKCLAAWLYEDCDLCLERKRAIALEFFQWQPKLYRRSHITTKIRKLFGHLLPERSLTQSMDL